MKLLRLVSLLLLLSASSSFVNAQTEDCVVTTYFRDLEAKSSSSRFLIGEFPLKLEDDTMTKLFQHQESGVDISVGVAQVKGIFENEPKRIRIAISFGEKPNDVFDELESVEAESIYDKHWRWLAVSKNIQLANRIYTFTFGCEKKKGRGR